MKSKFHKLIYGSWASTLFFFVFGILLFAKPKLANSLIGYIIGAIILASGIVTLANYFYAKKEFKYMNFEIIYGIVTIIAGLSIIFNPLSISSIVTIGLGIWMAINGIMKLNTSLFLKKRKEETWILLLIIGILTLMSGSLLIFNPFESTMVVTQVLGVFIIVYAILDSMHWLLIKKRSKNIIEFIK